MPKQLFPGAADGAPRLPQPDGAAPPPTSRAAATTTTDGMIRVKVEALSYLQILNEDTEVPRRRGDEIEIPIAEYQRVPWTFKPLGEIEAEKKAAERPAVDARFEQLRESAIASFDAQKRAAADFARRQVGLAKKEAQFAAAAVGDGSE